MEAKSRVNVKRSTGTVGTACLLVVACTWFSPRVAVAQNDAASAVSPSQKTGGTKTANPKKHAKAAASTSRTSSTPSAKAHQASHPPADKHPKSNAAVAAHNNKAKNSSSRKNGKSKSKRKSSARGQQKIEPERAQAIQEALIREHYMTGEPGGTWNQASEDAMRRYQADHGWQSKTVPDSRALISLGLGPSKDHLLNPESAMTTGPDVSHAASVSSSPQIPASHSAEPGARMNTNATAPTERTPPTPPAHDAPVPK